jgi:hypothetical protein
MPKNDVISGKTVNLGFRDQSERKWKIREGKWEKFSFISVLCKSLKDEGAFWSFS